MCALSQTNQDLPHKNVGASKNSVHLYHIENINTQVKPSKDIDNIASEFGQTKWTKTSTCDKLKANSEEAKDKKNWVSSQ